MAYYRTIPFDSKTLLTKVVRGKTILKARKKQRIYSQGDASVAVFYIIEGKVKLSVVSESGKEAVISILGPERFFGEACLGIQQVCRKTATCMENSTIVRIEKEAMLRVLYEEPGFAELFITYLLSRNIRIEEDLLDQRFNGSEKRLARVLVLLARFGKESEREPVLPKVSQETLADLVGTTRSRISFFLTKFRKQGFIDYKGGLHVHRSILNMVRHDEAPPPPLSLPSSRASVKRPAR
jgi:CRP/FNR family cyclic AMP-dependent transcriptional regulator